MADDIFYRKTRADGSGEEYGEPKFTGASKIDQSYGAYMGKPKRAHEGSQSSAPGKEDDLDTRTEFSVTRGTVSSND